MKNITYKLQGSDKSDLDIYVINEDDAEGGELAFTVIKRGENAHQIDFEIPLDELEGFEKFIGDCRTYLYAKKEIILQREPKKPDEENLTLHSVSARWWSILTESSKQSYLDRFKFTAEEVYSAHVKFMYEIITKE